MDLLKENNLTLHEYFTLFALINKDINNYFTYGSEEILSLEQKGFLKIVSSDKQSFRKNIFLREKAEKLFTINVDLFEKWLETYPTNVKKRNGSTRALSPKGVDTVLGRSLKAKWDRIFKNDVEAQEKAILVLELEIADKTRSGDLEYMVEATRWLNEGFYEKYEYLIEEFEDRSRYNNEDHL